MPKTASPTTEPTWTPLLLNILPSMTDLLSRRPRQRLRLLAGDSETNRGPISSPSPQPFLGTRLARYSGSVAYRSALSLPGKCLTGMPFRVTVHQPLGGCVYRKLKPERSGDEVRPKGRVNL